MPTPKPTPKPKPKVKGAIIQGKESRAAYGIERETVLSLRKQTQTPCPE